MKAIVRSLLRLRRRDGVTLVEIIVALAILSVVLMALAGLMFQVSQQTRRSTTMSYLSAAAQGAQTRMEGLSWDQISPPLDTLIVGCATDTSGQMVYTRCTTVTDISPVLKRLRVVLQPTGNLAAPPETVVVDRIRHGAKSPFTYP